MYYCGILILFKCKLDLENYSKKKIKLNIEIINKKIKDYIDFSFSCKENELRLCLVLSKRN